MIKHKFELAEVESLFKMTSEGLPKTFFLSKSWIISWLSVIHDQVSIAIFYLKDTPIGFALLGRKRRWFGDIYYLNQTGSKDQDQMWIEHNDIICVKEYIHQCRASLLSTLSKQVKFHRIVLSMVADEYWHSPNLFNWSSDASSVSYVDYHDLRNSQKTYESTLSKNSKSSLRRAAKYINTHIGEITMRVNTERLSNLLNEKLAPLHMQQWANTQHGSGFSNPIFNRFLGLFCSHNENEQHCEILSFHAGEKPLGYLLNIINGADVYFYLSAINYDHDDNKYKPGLVIHKMAIEHYAQLNFNKYDFLAGEARYKQSLSTHEYNMYTVQLAKNTWLNKLMFKANRMLNALINKSHN